MLKAIELDRCAEVRFSFTRRRIYVTDV